MGSIRNQYRPASASPGILFCLVIVLICGRAALFSQTVYSTGGADLAQEIKNAESTLIAAASANSPAQKAAALIRLARLEQLSGNMESASKNWLLAAAAEQGVQKDNSLLAGAFCLAAMGEWEQAAAAVAPLLQSSSRARYLDACGKAWLHADASALRAMAENPAYGELRSVVYYTLWKLAGGKPETKNSGTAAEWKVRLGAEFPRSPENRIITAEDAATQTSAGVSSRPSLLWLLMSGNKSPQPEETPAAAAPPPMPVHAGRLLQTGLFGRETNAQNQAKRLEAAGFSSVINRRTVSGNEFWSVAVPGGNDINRTISELKNAGFDSFPL